MTIIVRLSGADVLEVEGHDGHDVQVRQYHTDFRSHEGPPLTDEAGTYEVAYRSCTCEINGRDDPDCERHHPEVEERLLVVAAGHAEYGCVLPSERPRVEVIWDPHGDDLFERIGGDDDEAGSLFAARNPGVDAPDCDLTWEQVWRVGGTVEEIRDWYASLLTDLGEDPGGDDGTYDYWPSGVRLARQIAQELGEDEAPLDAVVNRVLSWKGLRRDEVHLA